MTAWLVILALVGAAVYFDEIGLPEFITRRIIQNLHARGVDLQFSRIRLRFYQGLIADNVRFGQADAPLSPQLTAVETAVEINSRALARFQFQIDSIRLRKARLVVPIVETNNPARQLTVQNIQAELHFLPGDQWALDNFAAEFAGAKFRLRGSVTHASAVPQWKIFHAGHTMPASFWQDRFRHFADLLDRIHFAAPPQFALDLRGDALDPDHFEVLLTVSAPGAVTPWGTLTQGRCEARLYPAATNELSHGELRIKAASARTPWADANDFQLTVQRAFIAGLTNLVTADARLTAADARTAWAASTNLQLALHLAPAGESNLINADLALSASQVVSKWGGATNASFVASWLGALTNAIPLNGHGRFHCDQAASPWGQGRGLDLLGSLTSAPPVETTSPGPAGLPFTGSWWTNLESCALDLELHLATFKSPKVQARSLACLGRWRAPELTVTQFHALVYDGRLDADAALDTTARKVQFHLASEVDPHRIALLFPESARSALTEFSWGAAPVVKANAGFVLPPWTNRPANWFSEIEPSLLLEGEVSFDRGGAFRGVSFTNAHSHITCSNRFWRLPDLTIARPEGRVATVLQADAATRDFYSHIRSTMDVTALRQLLRTNQTGALDIVALGQPPLLDAELWGRGNDPNLIGAKGHITLTNFVVRGQSAASFDSDIQYTNGVLQLRDARLLRGRVEDLRVSTLAIDFPGGKIYLTNGYGVGDPKAVTRAIGPEVAAVMAPYEFVLPPKVHAHGIIPLHNTDDADLAFEVEGGPFHWALFNLPAIAGNIHWQGQHLTLTNMHADFYGGNASGSAAFDFASGANPVYSFKLSAADADLHWLMTDLRNRTNNLEGRLNGNLDITHANAGDWRQTEGMGSLSLRDGLIWDIPLFGILSGALNGIAPGLGSSRANAATCTFVITNGFISTDDLEIRCPTMRVQYRGTVDLQQHINARVEAGLLRDMWVIGPVLSTVFWPVTKVFEYKVTGTLENPKTDPLYLIPKILLLPFHPIRTLKDLVPANPAPPSTNAPPITAPLATNVPPINFSPLPTLPIPVPPPATNSPPPKSQ